MSFRTRTGITSLTVLGAFALLAPLQGCRKPPITMVAVAPLAFHAELGERGDVVFNARDLDLPVTPTRAFRWYQGETTELTPDLPDTAESSATGVNATGQVIGRVLRGPTKEVFTTTADGSNRTVAIPYPNPRPADIDDSGRLLVNWDDRPEYWGSTHSRAGVVDGDQVIPSPKLGLSVVTLRGWDMNNNGDVVGDESADLSFGRALRWRIGEDLVDLGHSGNTAASAMAVNDAGSVLVASADESGNRRMFLWKDGQVTDLGDLGGGDTGEGAGTYSGALNEAGQVAGRSSTASNTWHAFLWSEGTMHDLGTLGGDYSEANDVNDLGEVVGVSTTADGKFHAFLWRNGVMTDLGALMDEPDRYSEAEQINNRGQVLAWADTSSGESERRFVLFDTRNRA